MSGLDRRRFLGSMLASAAALALPGCSDGDAYTEDDVARLERQRQAEAAARGKGPWGELRFRGYRGLAELPYFELDGNGELRLTVEGLPPAIDFHAHLGMNLLFAPEIDLLQRTPRIQYLLDCDRDMPGCELDLDVYINSAFSEEMHDELSSEITDQLFFGSDAAATHTIPNLVDELDRVRFGQAVILPIALGLPFGDRLTEAWLDAIGRSEGRDRIIPFASVHPSSDDAPARLRDYAARGARGVKLHPEMQRFFPDAEGAMAVYTECERLGLPILFHAGRSGIEPEFMRKYALIRRWEAPVRDFPKVQFVLGHAGARDVDDAIALARANDNVWLEITGQGVTKLDEILRKVGPEKLVFGSDWPFYPLAATLAKVLLVTEKRQEARAAILRTNADRIFAAAQSAARRG
jgi:predicted TIM-barrel fold metal-dependent hydrolase